MKTLLIFVLFLLSTSAALAYIPPYWMIVSRTSDNHGKGNYVIEQNVVFNHAAEPQVVKERWIVAGDNSMRLEVTGQKTLKDNLRLTYVYQNDRKYFIDENGIKKAVKIPEDFLEIYFHYRYSKNIKPILVAQNIAPAVSLKSEPHKYSVKTPFPAAEPYVRLARTGGVTAYAIGTPTPVSATEAYPGLWIEQDQFLIRKIRLSSLVEVEANNYNGFSNGLWLPQERTINWGNHLVKITLDSVKPAPSSVAIKNALEPAGLKFGENPNLSLRLPNDEVIKAFYNRMR